MFIDCRLGQHGSVLYVKKDSIVNEFKELNHLESYKKLLEFIQSKEPNPIRWFKAYETSTEIVFDCYATG